MYVFVWAILLYITSFPELYSNYKTIYILNIVFKPEPLIIYADIYRYFWSHL